MKPGIHPDYHPIKVTMTDGTEYTTRSTWGKMGDNLQLDIDSKSHPAWTGGQQQLLDRGGRLTRFNKRFEGLIKEGDKGAKISAPAAKAPPQKSAKPKEEKPKTAKSKKEAAPKNDAAKVDTAKAEKPMEEIKKK